MTRADELALERRKVAALESIAASLQRITGEDHEMVAKRPPMMTTPAVPAPQMVQEAPDPEDDEVEPMNDEDSSSK